MMTTEDRKKPTPAAWMVIAAVGIYAVGDLLSGLFYANYSFSDQAISELTAYGSPVRPLMMTIMLVHGALLIAFGASLFHWARWPSLRWTGALLAAANLATLPTHTVWAMSSRGMQTGFNDTMHANTTLLFSVFVGVSMAASALIYRGWFRLFALGALVVIAGFGMAAANAMSGVAQNNTPWAGAFERVNCYVYFAWLVALALLVRSDPSKASYGRGAGATQPK